MPFSQQSLFSSPYTMAHLGNKMTFKSTLEDRERANVIQQWHDPHFSHPKHKPQQEYWEQSLTHKAATFFPHCRHSQRLSRFFLYTDPMYLNPSSSLALGMLPPCPLQLCQLSPLPALLAKTTTTQAIAFSAQSQGGSCTLTKLPN